METLPGGFVRITLALSVLAFTLTVFQSAQAASFTNTGSLNLPREFHTATLLSNGKVLVVGGMTNVPPGAPYTSGAELYDPATGSWANTGSLNLARENHTATTLPDGRVLVAGGSGAAGAPNGSEIYDPATGVWTNAGFIPSWHSLHTATLLPGGQVLVVGGFGMSGSVTNTDVYDPATGHWTMTNGLNTARRSHTATLLPNGQVLVTGGQGNGGYTNDVELFDPSAGLWTETNAMANARYQHTATLLPGGRVLVVGGFNNSGPLASAEVFDPATGTWTATNGLSSPRFAHTATLLPNGRVLVAGGYNNSGHWLSSAELFDPVAGSWTTVTGGMKTARDNHTATLLANGQLLVAGGFGSNTNVLSSAELFDYAKGIWTYTGSMNTARVYHTATVLPNGKVLAAGGYTNVVSQSSATSTSELYDPVAGTWSYTGSLNTARDGQTANLLPGGKVLVAGGEDANVLGLYSAEVYDPATEMWTNTGVLNFPRNNHTATLLPNGKVLVAGGITNSGITYTIFAAAEIYDPASGQWTLTGTMNTARQSHTATLLPNGKVLVSGGGGVGGTLDSAELFDPASGVWTNTGAMNSVRGHHTATLLPNGKVLVTGGVGSNNVTLSSAELYDPSNGTWTNTGALKTPRWFHQAILLPNGKVLIAGGENDNFPSHGFLLGTELYDPATGTWTTNVALNIVREAQTSTLLANGEVLVAGGNTVVSNGSGGVGSITNSCELYNVGLGYSNSWQPQIITITSPLNLGGNLAVTGSQFRGISEGSGGSTQGSPSDYPLVQLRSLESGQTVFSPSTNWSATNFNSATLLNFPPGWALATVFVNGIPSTSSIINISVPVPTPPILTGASTQPDGSFQFGFTNTVGALFGVLATTDLSQPVTNWTALGGVTENPPGQFQFTDPQATNFPQRYYSVRVP